MRTDNERAYRLSGLDLGGSLAHSAAATVYIDKFWQSQSGVAHGVLAGATQDAKIQNLSVHPGDRFVPLALQESCMMAA